MWWDNKKMVSLRIESSLVIPLRSFNLILAIRLKYVVEITISGGVGEINVAAFKPGGFANK